MKNRVQDLIDRMINLIEQSQELEIRYIHTRKGEVYYNTVNILKSKMKGCQQAMSDLFITSTKELVKYSLSYNKPLKKADQFKIININYILPSHLTTSEIITYFEYINRFKVCYIKAEGKLEIGIPRIPESGK